MATLGSASETGNAVMLEARRDDRAIPVTIHYAAIREVRAALEAADTDHGGFLYGSFTAESISIQPKEGQQKIGIYRAQPGGWPALTEADRKKMREPLPKGGVLLVVRTLVQRPWSATLYAVDYFQPVASETPLMEFPFDEYLLRNGWLTDLAPPLPPPPQMTARRRVQRPKAGWIVAGTGAAMLTAALAWRWMPPTAGQAGPGGPAERAAVDVPAAPVSSASPLGLKVARTASDLELSWNRMADAIRYASTGRLTIRNGAVLRTIEVTPEQLHEGRVVYHPLSGVDVNVRMEVMTSDGRREAESVEFLGFDTAPSTTHPTPPPPTRSTPPPRSRPVPLQNADRMERNTAPTERARRSAPTSGPSTEPIAIRRANPDLSRDVQSEMRAAKGKVSVSVLASIDSAGTVQSVKVVSSTGEPSPSGPYIRLAALNAARQWRFRPATAAGKPVPSQTTLVFNF